MKYSNFVLIVLLSLCSKTIVAQNSTLANQPGYYRTQVSEAIVYSLFDGTYPVNVGEILHGIPRKEIAAKMQSDSHDTIYNINFSAFLIVLKEQRILVDTGCGTFMGSGAGNLVTNLKAVGLGPEDITAVLITHAHADHVGGLINASNERVFPNATVYLNKAEKDYWLSAVNKKNADASNQPIFDQVEKALTPYIAVNKIKTFSAGSVIIPGISTIDTHGHTPGSTAYLLESGSQKMLFAGDIVHIAPVQFSNPEVTIDFDISQPTAKATRAREFEIMASKGYWVAAPHMPFPGIGHISAVGGGYKWAPIYFGDTIQKKQ
ncbi:MBL fold metallo-hydrolase [Flavobacterium pectinovorum]|uniref:Glyoxylase, beta-lactamase superfamily II n=1 Tax=Flavobacterium pectinovorum TaxID=29533 RepID=A0AB36P756_9FLAO|nr:MBL fold metallo-hydrolase [Flavobacterium pectinovorum]OXB07743.1 hypothetical protein B0A72_02430 [Flavobacterium pectinovorum]SHM78925.1 Glyoxylase, beta-lactamase superfamily II [Flavobacterium pectinovorum]